MCEIIRCVLEVLEQKVLGNRQGSAMTVSFRAEVK